MGPINSQNWLYMPIKYVIQSGKLQEKMNYMITELKYINNGLDDTPSK